MTQDQTIEPREVRVGMNNKVDAQILEGLREGEQVVIGDAAAGSETSSSVRRGVPYASAAASRGAMRRGAPLVEAARVARGFTGPWAIRSLSTASAPRNRFTRARMSAD